MSDNELLSTSLDAAVPAGHPAGSNSCEPEQPAEDLTNKKYLTLREYVFSTLNTASDNLKGGGLGVWGGMVTTIFLKLSPEAFITLAAVNTVISVLVQPYNLFAARLSDRMTSYKKIVYMLIIPSAVLGVLGSVPVAIMFPGMTDTLKIIYFCGINVMLAVIGPYLGNAATVLGIRMTPSSRERGLLGTINNTVGGVCGSITGPLMSVIILLFASVVPYEKGTNEANAYYFFYGTILFTVTSVILALAFNHVRQIRIPAPQRDPAEKPSNIIGVAKAILMNKPLVLKKVSNMISAWGGIGGSSFSLIVTKYYQGIELDFFGRPFKPELGWLFFMFSLTQTIPSVISLALTPAIRKRFSDKQLVITTMLWQLAGSLFSFFTLSGLFFQLSRMQKYIIHMFCYSWGGWTFGFNVCGQVMDLELFDYSEWQTGERNECTFNYVTGLFHWICTLPVGVIAAYLLVKTGYRTDRPNDPLTEQVGNNLFVLMSGGSLLFQILALIPMVFYDFSGEKRKRIMNELQAARERRMKAEQEAAVNEN
jgi:Na+/melibiose symporter-like transporter